MKQFHPIDLMPYVFPVGLLSGWYCAVWPRHSRIVLCQSCNQAVCLHLYACSFVEVCFINIFLPYSLTWSVCVCVFAGRRCSRTVFDGWRSSLSCVKWVQIQSLECWTPASAESLYERYTTIPSSHPCLHIWVMDSNAGPFPLTLPSNAGTITLHNKK